MRILRGTALAFFLALFLISSSSFAGDNDNDKKDGDTKTDKKDQPASADTQRNGRNRRSREACQACQARAQARGLSG